LLCFSQPRRSRKQDADRLSHCLLSRLAPRPGQTVILLADARHRVEGIPGLTDFLNSLRQRERSQCALSWHLLVCGHRINEVTTATLGTLPLARPPKSKRFPQFPADRRRRFPGSSAITPVVKAFRSPLPNSEVPWSSSRVSAPILFVDLVRFPLLEDRSLPAEARSRRR